MVGYGHPDAVRLVAEVQEEYTDRYGSGDAAEIAEDHFELPSGLFAVGGWAQPGGGLPHAGMSGALVAGLIVEGPGFRGSR